MDNLFIKIQTKIEQTTKFFFSAYFIAAVPFITILTKKKIEEPLNIVVFGTAILFAISAAWFLKINFWKRVFEAELNYLEQTDKKEADHINFIKKIVFKGHKKFNLTKIDSIMPSLFLYISGGFLLLSILALTYTSP